MIYTISERLNAAMELSEEGLVDEDAIKEAIIQAQGELHVAVVDAVKAITNMKGFEASLKEEAKRLTDRAKVFESRRIAVESSIVELMTECNEKKVEDQFFTVTLCKGREKVEIEDSDQVPDEYKAVKTVITDDKKLIMAAHKEGKQVPGSAVVRGSGYLRIS